MKHASSAAIGKTATPHWFRHSFLTHKAVDALKEWKLGVWKEDARKLLDEQDRYTHDDVVDAFIEYHSRINKLKEIEASTSEEL